MEQHFRNLSKFYKSYFKLKGKLDGEYEIAKASGNYSRGYLGKLKNQHLETLKNERSVIARRMTKAKEEFLMDLSNKYNFEKNIVSSNLQKLLNSGIQFNERELLEIAERHKDNLTESRILHDFAEEKGYKLSNYIPYEDVVLNFDNYCKHISDSLSAKDGFTMPYLTLEDCEMAGGKYCKMSVVPKMEIEIIPETAEEELIRDIQKQNEIAVEKQKAFLTGLQGTEEEKENFTKKLKSKDLNMTEEERLKANVDMLTSEEKADAEYLSIYNGNKGEITNEELEFLKSTEYKKVVEVREQEKN